MKRLIHLIIKYTLISIPFGIVLAFLEDAEVNPWVYTAILCSAVIVISFFIYELLQLKNESVSKKQIAYIIIITGELIALIILAELLGENNLLSMVGVNVLFLSAAIILIYHIKTMQNIHVGIIWLLRITIGMLIVGIVVNNIIFLVTI